jgi:hypothetical protein
MRGKSSLFSLLSLGIGPHEIPPYGDVTPVGNDKPRVKQVDKERKKPEESHLPIRPPSQSIRPNASKPKKEGGRQNAL